MTILVYRKFCLIFSLIIFFISYTLIKTKIIFPPWKGKLNRFNSPNLNLLIFPEYHFQKLHQFISAIFILFRYFFLRALHNQSKNWLVICQFFYNSLYYIRWFLMMLFSSHKMNFKMCILMLWETFQKEQLSLYFSCLLLL